MSARSVCACGTESVPARTKYFAAGEGNVIFRDMSKDIALEIEPNFASVGRKRGSVAVLSSELRKNGNNRYDLILRVRNICHNKGDVRSNLRRFGLEAVRRCGAGTSRPQVEPVYANEDALICPCATCPNNKGRGSRCCFQGEIFKQNRARDLRYGKKVPS